MVAPVTALKCNQGGIVVEVQGGPGMVARLISLGLRPGVYVTMKSGQPWRGPVTLRFGATELALGHGKARRELDEDKE